MDIYDDAPKGGVSIATVSRVLYSSQKVSLITIEKEFRHLGYNYQKKEEVPQKTLRTPVLLIKNSTGPVSAGHL